MECGAANELKGKTRIYERNGREKEKGKQKGERGKEYQLNEGEIGRGKCMYT